METETIISTKKEPEFAEFIHNQIKNYNNHKSTYFLEARQPDAITPLNIILQDHAGHYIGGLVARTYWGWLEIEDFYIPAELRGQGVGTKLLFKAEVIAVSRGCKCCYLTTYEFQARAFYEKQGYYITGSLVGYPPGSTYYWMRKDLQLERVSESEG